MKLSFPRLVAIGVVGDAAYRCRNYGGILLTPASLNELLKPYMEPRSSVTAADAREMLYGVPPFDRLEDFHFAAEWVSSDGKSRLIQLRGAYREDKWIDGLLVQDDVWTEVGLGILEDSTYRWKKVWPS